MRFNNGRSCPASYLPIMHGKHVQLLEIKPDDKRKSKKAFEGTWTATININGWPHDIRLWGQDELDVFRKVSKLFEEHGAHVVE